MVYDTQEIIERAHRGDMDYIKHALTLFTDFVAVLVRILVIMVRQGLPDYCHLDLLVAGLLQCVKTVFADDERFNLFVQLKNAADKSEDKKRKKRS